MLDLNKHIEEIIGNLPDSLQRKRIRYGFNQLKKALVQRKLTLQPETFFDPSIGNLLIEAMGISKTNAKTRVSEIRQLGKILLQRGIISPPEGILSLLGYPKEFIESRKTRLMRNLQERILIDRLSYPSMNNQWVENFLAQATFGKSIPTQAEKRKFIEYLNHTLGANRLEKFSIPEWKDRRKKVSLPWEDIPVDLRKKIEDWLSMPAKTSSKSRKTSSQTVMRNLLERYLGSISQNVSTDMTTMPINEVFKLTSIRAFLAAKQDPKSGAFSKTMQLEASLLGSFLKSIGMVDESRALQNWRRKQDFIVVKTPTIKPSFLVLVDLAAKEIETAIEEKAAPIRLRRIRDALIFTDAVISGKSAGDIAHRTIEGIRSEWPPSILPLLDLYLAQTKIKPGGPIWIVTKDRFLSTGTVRQIVQNFLDKHFKHGVTTKTIQDVWLAEYCLRHPGDVLTVMNQVRQTPGSVLNRVAKVDEASAFQRIDDRIMGGR